MSDFLVFLAQALTRGGRFLDGLTPIPWPLLLAVLLPVYATGLNVMIWLLRGRVWPLACDYPSTTRGHPCRNVVPGEWHRCRHHRRATRRRTDGHVVQPNLRRWQTISKTGQIGVRRHVGRGFLRLTGRSSTLLYRRGFARPVGDVVRFLPTWWTETRDRWRAVRTRLALLRASHAGWRAVLWPQPPPVAGVAARLDKVVPAARASLYCTAVGLLLVGVSVPVPRSLAAYGNYLASAAFLGTWAVLKQGVWLAADNWLRLAAKDVFAWAWPFVLFSVIGGAVLSANG